MKLLGISLTLSNAVVVGWFPSLQETMAEEPHRSPAAEISVTSNGETENSHDDVFQRVRHMNLSR